MEETADRKEKFTPGPWVDGGFGTFGPDGTPIMACSRYAVDFGEGSEEAYANSQLISAAPDMYAALSCVLALASTPTTKGELVYVDFTEIRSALSKARGES